jgi:predicted DNA-binding transcriptional regulator AlpA
MNSKNLKATTAVELAAAATYILEAKAPSGNERIISASVPEFSRLSGLGQSTIWAMLHDGRLESISIGRRRLVLLDSYHRLIQQQQASLPQDARRNGTVPPLGTTVARRSPLDVCIDDLRLGTRAANALRNAGIVAVGEVVQQTKEELLAIPNFGRVSLAEVEAALTKLKLHLGMQHPDWERSRHVATAAAAE